MPRRSGTARAALDFTWHGRVQLAAAIPADGERGVCSNDDCDRALCYCLRCVVPDSWAQVTLTMGNRPYCHEHLKAWLGWGPGRRVLHCSSCTCRET